MAELNVEAPVVVPTQGPGARLKAGREAQGQSLEQAARHLRLDEPTLAAIEADQYPAHVPATFLRGYLRAYAKWLELPADEIVSAYNEKHPDEAQLAGLKTLLALPESERSGGGKWLWFGVLALLLAAVVAAVVLLLPNDWLSQLKLAEDTATADNATAVEVLPIESNSGELTLQLPPEEPALTAPATTDAEPTTASASSSTATTTVPTATAPVASDGAATTAARSVQAVNNANVDDVPALPGAAETLELSFVEDCWIRVTDANGNVLSVGIKQNGQRIRLSGTAPLTVVLGNPPGVQLKHNGRPVDLSGYPGSRPATLTLQQQAND